MNQVIDGAVIERDDAPAAGALVKAERSGVLLMPVMDVALAKARLKEFQEYVQGYLQESLDGGTDGGDFGALPGAGAKKVLLKSGADKLCEIYGLYDDYEIVARVEDWDRGLFDFELRCVLKSRRDDSIVGTGLGSCSSFESKYRWRLAQRICPSCGATAIIKGRAEYGGGWVCFDKKGGCKAKFDDTDRRITAQEIGRVENPDIIDTKNTVLKMAKKRAKIDAVIGVTRSSGLFTQDLEDLEPADRVVVESVKPGEVLPAETREADAQPEQRTAAQPSSAGSSNGSNGSGADRKISEAQAKRLFAIGRDAGLWKDDYAAILRRHGYGDDREISRRDYELICKEVQGA